VDPAGKEVALRGTNLGGWLVEEMWMTPWAQDPPSGSPYPKVEDHFSLWETLTRRLGTEAAARVRTAWRNAWLQPSDFARIKAAGLNCVRVPFLYDLLDEPDGMDWLRNAVAWANAQGLYVILDLHGAPGGQNPWDHSGRVGLDAFFKDAGNLVKAEAVWTALAREFGANPGVAAFDLINEPVSAADAATLHEWHNRMYQAIRREAPDTLVVIEDGYKGIYSFPMPSLYGWTDVVYSTHIYKFDAATTQDHLDQLASLLPQMLQLRDTTGVPVFVGEFNLEPHNSPYAMRQYVGTLTDNGLAWTIWTWKTVARGGPMGFWGYYSKPGPADALNPFTDSEATLIGKMAQLRTENLTIPAGFDGVFR
jgi:aryl-phospho-beta-D-glucosidase BglC (GH1 family)